MSEASGQVPRAPEAPKVVAIVNLTRDSFSDGGRYLNADAALAHAEALLAAGADIIELGAESSHPEAETITAAQEIDRLAPVLETLLRRGVAVSVDSCRPDTQRFAMEAGAAYLNDITGFADRAVYGELAACACKLVVMHAVDGGAKATRTDHDLAAVRAGMDALFAARIAALAAAGVARERIVLDPGMGLFLSTDPMVSARILTELPHLRARFGLPLMVSVSRKSFLGGLTGRGLHERGAATLAAELYAAVAGASYLRTHDAGALVDGLRTWSALGVFDAGRA